MSSDLPKYVWQERKRLEKDKDMDKEGWKCGSSSRASAQQVQNPKFKPQYLQREMEEAREIK
jgi:hypothetical protein